MSSFILKIIAMLTMFCDHLGYTIYGKFSALNYIGRLAFPIFAFQISEGYLHTRSKKNYLLRLFLFAIISQVPFMLFTSGFETTSTLNVFFTLLIGLVAIMGYEQCSNKYIGVLLAVCTSFIADVLHTDYGSWGVIMIFLFHVFKNKKGLMSLSYFVLILVKYLPQYITYDFHSTYFVLLVCSLVPLIFINLYHGKKGKDMKYILYSFYPIHLIVLYLCHLLFF